MDEKEAEARPLMGTIFLVYICDRLWENRLLRAQYDFSVEAFVVYLT